MVQNNESTPQFLTKEQVAARLFVSYRTVEKLIKNGELPALKHGRAVRVNPDSLNTYIKTKESRNNY